MTNSQYLKAAVDAAHAAGTLLKQNFGRQLDVHKFEAHDIKLDLDVRSQELITGILLERFPDHAIYGEEGIAGKQDSPFQWIVDPIDGTVNFFYGIPHFCISIALRHEGKMILGVIFDPMRNELWEVEDGGQARLNGQPVRVSPRARLSDAVLSVGFAKSKASINTGLPMFEKMVVRVRKCRLMGSAALDLAYVATGRLDAYIESSVNLWDVAAGKLLVEAAGGCCELTPHPDQPDKLAIIATNGVLDLNVD
ncbi:MAG: inositol monophosphatase family protein [Chthoniobacteraceae bacterium]|nr:inositol monophosphatase family protein [Chthoniobacteraceae bacterium]